ncbi:MAG TPA: biotin/lipoyl-binding protein, partial [Balneolales bacterium]|nr:biotin/lipoyl-binding protein [Balneolales bacterium]
MHKSISFIGISLSLIVMYSCGGSTPNRRFMRGGGFNQATSVEVAQVSDSSISRQVVNYGTIKSSDVVNVTPQVSNRITHIYAHIGDTVKTGEVLAKIYDKTYRDQLTQNKAQLAQARSNLYRDSLQYGREQKLYKKSLVSDSEFESTR